MGYEIKFAISTRRENFVKNFLDSQDQSTRSEYERLAALLIQYGPALHFPYSRKLTDNLFELRSHGDTKIRIIYTRINESYILLHAFKKKTQKTPRKEIEVANKRRLTLI